MITRGSLTERHDVTQQGHRHSAHVGQPQHTHTHTHTVRRTPARKLTMAADTTGKLTDIIHIWEEAQGKYQSLNMRRA